MGCGGSKVLPEPPSPPPPLRNAWRKQIFVEGDASKFKPFAEWKATFEPVKVKKEKEQKATPESKEKTEAELKEEATKAEERRRKRERALDFALGKVAEKVTEKGVRLLMEFAATVLSSVGEAAEKEGKPALSGLANALSALACSFRFQHKGKHKFRYIRRSMVAQLVLVRTKAAIDSVEGAVEQKAKALGDMLGSIAEGRASVAIAHVSRLPMMQALQARAMGGPPSAEGVVASLGAASADAKAAGQVPPHRLMRRTARRRARSTVRARRYR